MSKLGGSVTVRSRIAGTGVAHPSLLHEVGDYVGGRFQLAVAAAALLVALALALPAPEDSVQPLAGTQTGALAPQLADAGLDRSATAPPSPAARRRALSAYGDLPLSFIPNSGQADERVRYYAQAGGFGFYLTRDRAVIALRKKEGATALELRFLGANPNAKLEATRPTRGTVNYIKGSDPTRWQTGLPTYREVAYRNLWPGVDLVFRGQGGMLKYELHLAPGADPGKIRLGYRGAKGLSIGAAGALLIDTPVGVIRDSRPRSYQPRGGRRVPIGSRYSLAEGATSAYGFRLGPSYDSRRPAVIDPGLTYSTYLGGGFDERGIGIAVDSSGNAYVSGETFSPGFPTQAAFDASYGGLSDVFVTKVNPAGTGLGTGLVYSTFLGGSSDDFGNKIAVDSSGSAYVAGETLSSSFPTTGGAFDTTFGGASEAFVTKLNAAGSALSYSTFLGGAADEASVGIGVDSGGGAYVSGLTASANFPTTGGAFDPTFNGGLNDGFVTKLNATGSALTYSTYLGGASDDRGAGIALDSGGSAYVTGFTDSLNYPTVGAIDATYNGSPFYDAFVTKVNSAGSALTYSTYLGGASDDLSSGIAVDQLERAYVTGWTASTGFPTTPGAFDTVFDGGADAFVAKLNPAGSGLAYSTFLGGASSDLGLGGIAVDADGSSYVTGVTASSNFPTTAGAFDTSANGNDDAFMSKLNPAGTTLAYSTYLGGAADEEGHGIAVDAAKNVYLTGWTGSSNFPTTSGAYDQTFFGGDDVFVSKLDFSRYSFPTGGTPFRVPLVPAFSECTPPGSSTHGGGLPDNRSCSNPQLASSTVTVGTSNTAGTRVANARIDVCSNTTAAGCTQLTASQVPDVRLRGNGSDVACKVGAPLAACPGGAGSDYDPNVGPGLYLQALDPGTDSNAQYPSTSATQGGIPCHPSPPNPPDCAAGADMTAVAVIPFSNKAMRITDSYNSAPSIADHPDCASTTSCSATVRDQDFPVPVVCKSNGDLNGIGSYCGVNTTANALVPNTVAGGKLAVVEIGELKVFDSGPDGTRNNSDDQLFAVQGLFIP